MRPRGRRGVFHLCVAGLHLRLCAWRDSSVCILPVTGAGCFRHSIPKGPSRSTGFPGSAHSALSGSSPGPGAGGFHLSAGDHSALQQWLDKNKALKDKALADAVAKQPWDPSVQALAALPEVVKRLGDDIGWTTDLGNAFLAQQGDVMDAVSEWPKAQDKGTLKTTEQQKVETQTVGTKQVIVIQQANPQVVYMPTYDPVIVYGPPIYPYPPIYYPPAWYYPTGLAVRSEWAWRWARSGRWLGLGLRLGWQQRLYQPQQQLQSQYQYQPRRPGSTTTSLAAGTGAITGNRGQWRENGVNKRPSRRWGSQRQTAGGCQRRKPSVDAAAGGDRGNWQHNPQHRGGAPYKDRATADRFGGTRGVIL